VNRRVFSGQGKVRSDVRESPRRSVLRTAEKPRSLHSYVPRLPQLENDWRERYETPERWVNYGLQIRTVIESTPESVLEVGPGTGTVSGLLRGRGLNVTTLDVDPRFEPDIVGSVHELTRHVPPKSFDTVLCAEVLEHLPFDLLETCCQQLATVARRCVVIGLPRCAQPHWGLTLKLRLPRWGDREITIGLPILPHWTGPTPDHYWSVDFRPYTLARVCDEIGKAFTVQGIRSDKLDPVHFLLICRPR